MLPRLIAGLAAGAVIVAAAAFVLTRRAVEPPAEKTTAPPPLLQPVLRGRSPVAAREGGGRTAAAGGASAPASAAPNAAAPAAPAAAPNTATLHFDSDVPGAKVFLDRQLVGEMPVTASDVKPGPHRLNVSVPGYDFVSETIEVTPGPRDIVFKFREVRLDARIDVIHKHRLGSCRGTLVATARGMRYETADKDDAFTAALLDLDTLEIDYLANRLRIGLRGKQYDFSDPAGNADPLFVFHRDVEKAQARLKSGDPPAPD